MPPEAAEPTPERARAALRGSQDRSLNREGIPMLLALVSESDSAVPEVTDPVALAEGQRLAELAGEVWTGVASHQRDDDMEVVVTVLHAAAYAEFDAGSGR